MQPEMIKKRFEKLKSDRSNLDGVLDLIRRFFVPLRSEFFDEGGSESSTDWRSREVFDSTAIESVDTLSASMQGALTSMSLRWFDLKLRDRELGKNQEVRKWLENVALEMWQALQESNFDIEASEYYIELVAYGNAMIVEEVDNEDTGEFVFKAVGIDACYFEEDHRGKVVNFYRRLMWTPLQIIEKFGEDDTPDWIKERNNTIADEPIEIIYCIFKRPTKNKSDVRNKLAPLERPFGYKYVIHKDAEEIGKEGGYYEQPAFISRWRRIPGSSWGYGPSHLCLSDVLTLNELTSDLLDAIGKAVDPTTLATQRNLLSDLDLGRGGITIVRDVNGLVPFESKARFDVGELKIERLQESIRKAFRTDQLQMKDSPAMTATEANIRYELMQRLLGPTLGRLKNDFLDPLIIRTFNILYRAGRFPPMPDIMQQKEMDIEYVGPMARSQKANTVSSVQQWLGGVSQVAEVLPEAMDLPNVDAVVRGLAELHGVPADMVNSKKDVDAKRKKREDQQEAMVNQELEAQAAATAKDDASAMATMDQTGQQA